MLTQRDDLPAADTDTHKQTDTQQQSQSQQQSQKLSAAELGYLTVTPVSLIPGALVAPSAAEAALLHAATQQHKQQQQPHMADTCCGGGGGGCGGGGCDMNSPTAAAAAAVSASAATAPATDSDNDDAFVYLLCHSCRRTLRDANVQAALQLAPVLLPSHPEEVALSSRASVTPQEQRRAAMRCVCL